ncbi:MAG: saccharopine dehydrogenase NADP-binding domain-containing protein [Pirellulales bacterium]|nr:saccharopine dehydrogenase NADP-binding domain-containing protein [Pirellulales bacterium]
MHRVLLLGAGKIGRMIAHQLCGTGEYELLVADANQEVVERLGKQLDIGVQTIDATNAGELAQAMEHRDTVISALSYRHNPLIAETALTAGLSYFDLTEDVTTTRRVRAFAEKAKPGQIFMPQCGLAPGFISIVANHLTKKFERLDSVRMRVGALPQFPTGALKYNLTWSTDGLINEYCNPCEAIHDGQRIDVLALEGLEHFSLDGVRYEAFNTSGGLGTLCESLDNKVRELNYKTVRYVGHRDLALMLVRELRLGERREVMKDILEKSLPITFQDVVITFCTVTGWREDQFVQISDARKIYHQEIDGDRWSAIQLTTAAGLSTVVDLHVAGKPPPQGFVAQEQVDFDSFLANRFGRIYDSQLATSFNRSTSSDS